MLDNEPAVHLKITPSPQEFFSGRNNDRNRENNRNQALVAKTAEYLFY